VNKIRFLNIIILLFSCISYGKSEAISKNKFDFIQADQKEIQEYRVVFHIKKAVKTDVLKKIFEQSLNEIADTIRNCSYGFGNIDDFPKATSNFVIGRYHYIITRLFVFNNYYSSRVAIDEKGEYLCLWSFKTSPTGSYKKSAPRITNKIAKKLLKTYSWLTIENSYTIKNKNKN
jgi:hypothetical protein